MILDKPLGSRVDSRLLLSKPCRPRTKPMRVGHDARFEVDHTGRGKLLDSALVSAWSALDSDRHLSLLDAQAALP